MASYAPAASGEVVPSVSAQPNADTVSLPLARLCRSNDTEAAPTCAHVTGWPSAVIDHAAEAEPRAAMSGPQLLHAVVLASATSAAMEQKSLELMRYDLPGLWLMVGCG
ncbi:MAG: hypothetical protein E6J91_00620 [Deltaproteobacteria bacterium]|nr:MAG: hypothetical protein E6J91_00620 [Deltaproteobacteria bacterium]